MAELICPKFGDMCRTSECQTINEPLSDAVPKVKRALGGANFNLVKRVLERKIMSEGDSLLVNLHSSITPEKTTLCPLEVIEGELGAKLGVVIAEQAMRSIAERCIAHTISDLSPHT